MQRPGADHSEVRHQRPELGFPVDTAHQVGNARVDLHHHRSAFAPGVVHQHVDLVLAHGIGAGGASLLLTRLSVKAGLLEKPVVFQQVIPDLVQILPDFGQCPVFILQRGDQGHHHEFRHFPVQFFQGFPGFPFDPAQLAHGILDNPLQLVFSAGEAFADLRRQTHELFLFNHSAFDQGGDHKTHRSDLQRKTLFVHRFPQGV